MRTCTTVVERDPETGLLVGYVPGFPGAHSQAATPGELQASMREAIAMLPEDTDEARAADEARREGGFRPMEDVFKDPDAKPNG